MVRIKYYMIIAYVCLAGSCAFASSEFGFAEESTEFTRSVSALHSLDFTDLVDECSFVTLNSREGLQNFREQKILDNIKLGLTVDDNDLTDSELNRLGVWELKQGKRIMLVDLHMMLVQYYKSFGELPDTGTKLFPELWNLSESDIDALDRRELFNQCAIGINPVNGRFYGDFSRDQWSPGGYFVEVIDDPNDIKARWPQIRMPIDPSNPNAGSEPPSSVWLIKVFGEKPDTVILEIEAWVV